MLGEQVRGARGAGSERAKQQVPRVARRARALGAAAARRGRAPPPAAWHPHAQPGRALEGQRLAACMQGGEAAALHAIAWLQLLKLLSPTLQVWLPLASRQLSYT